MASVRVLRTIRSAEFTELVVLYFMQGAALSSWLVPLSPVLAAHGMASIIPLAYSAWAVAAFISPLIFGAVADRHASPVKVLRGLSLATAVATILTGLAIRLGWPSWLVLLNIQLFSLCASPTASIAATIIFSRLADASKQFGPLRAMSTLGWMAGCWLVSVFNADTTEYADFIGAALWLSSAGVTFFLPAEERIGLPVAANWRERFGLDALSLLKNRDHRVVFITTALFCVPLAGFYPYAPRHLRELGFEHTTAWMSLAQVTEMMAMFSLGLLLASWRLKWIFACGLGFGILRFLLSALDSKASLLAGVILHGCSFTLVFITAQIYLEQRIESAWRARAQALLTLMNSGVGNLAGYLGIGWWFGRCTEPVGVNWTSFWLGLAGLVAIVMTFFLAAYRGKGVGLKPAKQQSAIAL
jgi:MFS family permease